MDGYPLNLILTVATASATIFLGFLPAKSIRAEFFARETLRAGLAWLLVAIVSPPAILHYPLIFALVCLAASWQFRKDNILNAKMWLSLASGLGISIGVMLILAVTPKASGYPPGLSQPGEALLLASIYLGGAVIGLAYVCLILNQNVSMNSGVTNNLVQRYAGLLLILALVRAAALLVSFGAAPGYLGRQWVALRSPAHGVSEAVTLFVLAVLVLPALAFYSKRATRLASRVQPTRALVAICLIGFMAEILARLLVL